MLETDTENPRLPVNAKNATKQLTAAKECALKLSVGFPVFVMIRDRSNQVSRKKYLNVYAQLKKYLSNEPKILTPKSAGLKNWDAIAPTIEVAFFPLYEINREELELLIKTAVYVPSKNAKKSMFRIDTHGMVFV
ncbi:hypothetical protein Q4488_14835 [Amphritea sp. 1_MG-2023]|uniref:hypothetical protein n=1 Tax=Amphritea sp. 1_MG-2023 TaxID=3062670 RepID=UPI0026E24DEA|nr:hypothetical protein [Amphritea sp. 1_MG-2023]MDO6564657.1 hypothetical protein [Amphritea sp. 1_MG-2023]